MEKFPRNRQAMLYGCNTKLAGVQALVNPGEMGNFSPYWYGESTTGKGLSLVQAVGHGVFDEAHQRFCARFAEHIFAVSFYGAFANK